MPVRNFVISLFIISMTVIGGTCLFGFCVQADSGDIANLDVIEKDIPIADTIIREDGKLDGQVLVFKKPEVSFGDNFDLVNNQKKVIRAERKNRLKKKKIADVAKQPEQSKEISIEMNSVLAEIKKQEQEVRNLLSELKSIKNSQNAHVDKEKENVTNTMANDNDINKEINSNTEKTKSIDSAKLQNDLTKQNEQQMSKEKSEPKIIASNKKTDLKKQKKFTPMVVEDIKPQSYNAYSSAFKDYSMDNSGRDNNETTDNRKAGSFEKAFSALRPEKSNKNDNILADRRKKANNIEKVSQESVKKFHNAYVNVDDVKKDFYKTYITENRYLKPFETEEEEKQEKKKSDRGHDILQLKIEFQENSASLSAVDVNILRYFVYIAQNDPTKGVQISISQDNMKDINKKKLAARRLAIVSAIFKEEGLSDSQIVPVLTDRDTESFTFSIVSIDKIENYQKNEGGKDMFGDSIGSSQTFRTMRW